MKHLIALLFFAVAAQAADRAPNIIFIMADDLGYTDVATFGSKYYETPNIDKLATQGMKLTRHHHCQNCQPTRAALMSGQYGARTGVYTVGGIDRFDWSTRPLKPAENVTELPLEKITVAQTLKKAGYATGMFGKWHLGEKGDHHPAKRGFDEAIVSMGQHFDFNTSPKTEYPKGEYLADFLTGKAVDFIQRHKEAPFFLYLPHFGVHSPHQAKKELIAKFKDKAPVGGHNSATYAAMIASVDESVGRVMATLDELKLADNTVLIFTSDNGGVGGYEREGVHGGDITDNAPLRSGKGSLYEGGTRVPTIVSWAGRAKLGKVSVPVHITDWMPTFAALAGYRAERDLKWDGTDILPLLTAHTPPAERTLYGVAPNFRAQSVRRGDWKLVVTGAAAANKKKSAAHATEELFHLIDDPAETKNLATTRPDILAQMRTHLAAASARDRDSVAKD